jgi:hypothetical protein
MTPDARCADCIDLGVECPKGYRTDAVKCNVCGWRAVAVSAACVVPIRFECGACNAMTCERLEIEP